MIYTFMNKNAELFELEMDRGQAEKLMNFRENNLHLLPVFLIPKRNMGISRRDFNDWWSSRRIPASRHGVKELFWQLNNISLDELAEKALGLSLSDQYWIRPSSDISWESVNFFMNDFSDDIGNLLITGDWGGGNLSSPDNTSDGVVKKRWKTINGTRCLVKGSSDPFMQTQPFREVFASRMAEILFKPFGGNFVVPYRLMRDGEFVYSVCPNFVHTDIEYVSFNQIHQAYKKPNHISEFSYCREFHGKYAYVLDLLLLLDYIVLNEDRHFGNFGMIRSVTDGEFVKPAPVFDTGSSLFFDSPSLSRQRIKSKPFSKDFDIQIQMVEKNLYYDSLVLVKECYRDLFYDVFADSFEDGSRLAGILNHIKSQIDNLFEDNKRIGSGYIKVFD